MRVVLGLLLLLLGLCGSGAQEVGGGLSEVGEIREFQRTAPRDVAEESKEQTTKQTTPDIWAEVRALRDMVVELKVYVELLQKENSVQEIRLSATESKASDLEKENADLQTRLSSSESELVVSKSRIDQLERENAVHEIRLSATESKSSDLEKENADLQTRLSSSESEFVVSKSRIDQLEKENADLQTRLSSSESELVICKSRIDQLERENAEKPKVAFYAGLTNAGNVGPYNTDTTLKYSNVHTNFGNAYNPSTGFFRAPVKGVYYLQFTVFGFHAGHMNVNLYKNSQWIMHNWEVTQAETPEYFTNSVILELEAQDEINLVLASTAIVYDDGSNRCTFSGSLLFPL